MGAPEESLESKKGWASEEVARKKLTGKYFNPKQEARESPGSGAG